uniref:Beta-1,4-N-acetylgalactosaminyltransferase n=1 Tax=Clastoptera arizonana TaxID=38151 RepID=A0A1B6CF73_9HEMI
MHFSCFLFRKCFRYSSLNREKLMFLVAFVLVTNILIYLLLYMRSCVKIITLQEIPTELVPFQQNLKLNEERTYELCEIMPQVTNGSWPFVNITFSEDYLNKLALRLNVQPGGSWKPTDCVSQHYVAIIIPFRDRQSNLNSFLAHMHPFLQFQKLSYRIIIVEQSHQRAFNRAKLFNVGFAEAEKISPFHCYIFHDVDLIPENIHNLYGCTKLPRHLSAHIDIFDYKLPYDIIFGGAVAILKSQFQAVNGFSNKFYGWGGEDDDFYKRVTKNGSYICRYESTISRYIMLNHRKETPNEDRYYFLQTGVKRFETDGLNSLQYSVKNIDFFPLYTKISVDL